MGRKGGNKQKNNQPSKVNKEEKALTETTMATERDMGQFQPEVKPKEVLEHVEKKEEEVEPKGQTNEVSTEDNPSVSRPSESVDLPIESQLITEVSVEKKESELVEETKVASEPVEENKQKEIEEKKSLEVDDKRPEEEEQKQKQKVVNQPETKEEETIPVDIPSEPLSTITETSKEAIESNSFTKSIQVLKEEQVVQQKEIPQAEPVQIQEKEVQKPFETEQFKKQSQSEPVLQEKEPQVQKPLEPVKINPVVQDQEIDVPQCGITPEEEQKMRLQRIAKQELEKKVEPVEEETKNQQKPSEPESKQEHVAPSAENSDCGMIVIDDSVDLASPVKNSGRVFRMVESQDLAEPESKEYNMVESIEVSQGNGEIKEQVSFSDLNLSESLKEKQFNKSHSVQEAATLPPPVKQEPEREQTSELIPIESKTVQISVQVEKKVQEEKKQEEQPKPEKQVIQEQEKLIKIPVQMEKESERPDLTDMERSSLLAQNGDSKSSSSSSILVEQLQKDQDQSQKQIKHTSIGSKLMVSSVATVAIGGLTWVVGKSPKSTIAAGAVAFAASFLLNK